MKTCGKSSLGIFLVYSFSKYSEDSGRTRGADNALQGDSPLQSSNVLLGVSIYTAPLRQSVEVKQKAATYTQLVNNSLFQGLKTNLSFL